MKIKIEELNEKWKNFEDEENDDKEYLYERKLQYCLIEWVEYWKKDDFTFIGSPYLPIFLKYLNEMNKELKKELDEYLKDYLKEKKKKKFFSIYKWRKKYRKRKLGNKRFVESEGKGRKKEGFIFFTVKSTEKEAEKTGLKEISKILRKNMMTMKNTKLMLLLNTK